MGDVLRGSVVFVGEWAERTATSSIDLQHEPQIKPQKKTRLGGEQWCKTEGPHGKRTTGRWGWPQTTKVLVPGRGLATSEASSSKRKNIHKKKKDYRFNFSSILVLFCLQWLSASTLLATNHEKRKYMCDVKQLVNLWNTLAMRSAALYSFQLENRKKNEGRKKTEKKHTMLATTSEEIFKIHELFHFALMNNSGWPAHHWGRETEGEGDYKKKEGGRVGRCAEVVVRLSGCSCCCSTSTKPASFLEFSADSGVIYRRTDER